jgi:hypothetical protein
MTVDWIGKNFEGPATEVFVGRRIEEARQEAAGMAEIEMVREMGPDGTFTLEHREGRLSLLVVDDVVVAAGMF